MIEILSGRENMQKDLENFLKVERGERYLLVRFYRWQEPTVSIGLLQRERKMPLPVVRRPTGGGELLHGGDVSFSVASWRDLWGSNPKEIYGRLMVLLQESLNEVGISLDMTRYSPERMERLCFFYPSWGELTADGKKVVACAMRIGRRAFLLQGSLLIDMEYSLAHRVFGVGEEILRERITTFRELGVEEDRLLEGLRRFMTNLTQIIKVVYNFRDHG